MLQHDRGENTDSSLRSRMTRGENTDASLRSSMTRGEEMLRRFTPPEGQDEFNEFEKRYRGYAELAIESR